MEIMKKEVGKSVIIDGELHSKLKLFCAGKNMKIGGAIENLIKLYLKQYKEVQKLIDNLNEAE